MTIERVRPQPTVVSPSHAATSSSARATDSTTTRQPASQQATAAARRGASGAEASARAARSARETAAGQSVGPRRGLGADARPAATPQAADRAFDARIAELTKAVAEGRPGAAEALRAVSEDREGITRALHDVAAQLAAARDPAQRAQLTAHLQEISALGVRLARASAQERADIKRFFEVAQKDPAAIERLIASTKTGAAAPTTTIQPGSTSTGIQAAIDFGLTQLGAPYVGGASPFRFGTPGDGKTYQMEGQRPHVSPKGVIGYDCSGLVVTMLKKAGIDLSGMASSSQMKARLPQVPKDQLQPGDLLVKNGHVSMYIGNGQMIESVPAGVRVVPASTYINDPAYTGHRPG